MEEIGVLRTIPLFAGALAAEQLATLASATRLITFTAGSVLMWQGEAGDSMFAIVEGDALVIARDRSGTDVEVARLGAGDIVGEMSLLTGAKRRATVQAVNRVTALEIGKADLEPILGASPELVDRFAALMEARQAALDKAYDAAGHWNILGLDREHLAALIGRFFRRG